MAEDSFLIRGPGHGPRQPAAAQDACASIEMSKHAAEDYQRCVLPITRTLHGSALRLTRNSTEAEDLVQETLMRGWLFWRRFEAGSNLAAWLRRIMLNLYISRYHRQRRARDTLSNAVFDTRQAAETPRPDPDACALLREQLLASLATLPELQREMFWAVYACDMSYEQAAMTFGCPVGTVMSRLHRTRRSLQRRLKSVALDHGYVSV